MGVSTRRRDPKTQGMGEYESVRGCSCISAVAAAAVEEEEEEEEEEVVDDAAAAASDVVAGEKRGKERE